MKAAELREKSVEELDKSLLELLQSQFKLRLKKASGELSQTHLFKQTKRAIARIITIKKEKEGK